ncbi:MAG: M48 family metallopeptidase [Spirochaetales bacterium]|nr:M48 family metallopeptidase [Spirochaetales bacterium]
MKTRRQSRTARLLLIAVSGAALTGSILIGCASLGVGDIFEIAQKSAPAVQKSFEDITPEQEHYIGRAVGATILTQYDPYAEAGANEYLNLLGRTLALASDRPETFGGYHFLILDSQEINAFAAPGGLIFVSRGLLGCADSEETVAAILAHEIAHVVKQHGLQAIKKSRVTSALTSVAIASAQTAGSDELAKLTTVFEDSISDITATLVNSGYSRAFEKEADLMAVAILQRVGYDPNALVRMLEVMETRLTPGGPDFAKTHPEPEVRIAEIRKVLAAAPAAPPPAVRQARYQAALGGL